jgi:hypothetical protein
MLAGIHDIYDSQGPSCEDTGRKKSLAEACVEPAVSKKLGTNPSILYLRYTCMTEWWDMSLTV